MQVGPFGALLMGANTDVSSNSRVEEIDPPVWRVDWFQ